MPSDQSLRSVKFVVVCPEDVEGAIGEPTYARVTRRGAHNVSVKELKEQGAATWSIPREKALARAVTASEVEAFKVAMLRKAVLALSDGQFLHGQVIGCDQAMAHVSTVNGTVDVAPVDLSVTSPVVALLLYDVAFDASEWSLAEVVDVQDAILERILGDDGTNDMQTILEGYVDVQDAPSPTKMVDWVDPLSGEERQFPIQHAVDFAYFVDGESGPAPAHVGESFCRPVSDEANPSKRTRYARKIAMPNRAGGLFDAQVDDDLFVGEDEDDAPNVGLPVRTRAHDEPPSKRVRISKQAEEMASAAEIARALAGQPRLHHAFVARYMDGCSTYDIPCDGFVDEGDSQFPVDNAPRRGRAGFVPTPSQTRVHAAITADRHRGKPPAEFLEGLIDSPFVLFKPLPAVLVRVYDIQFGVRGLSVMHFQRLDLDEKVLWLCSGGMNLQHFASSMETPEPPAASSIHDVVSACQTLAIFAGEYFEANMKDVMGALVSLLQRLAGTRKWSAEDLPLLVYWINTSLGEIRASVMRGEEPDQETKHRFAMDNSELADILRVIHERRIARIEDGTREDSHRYERGRRVREDGKSEGMVAVPDDVDQLIPRRPEDDKQLCLRYLSVKGCKSTKYAPCFSGRAHFKPTSLHPRVKALIRKRFGGLKQEYASM